VSVPDDQPHTRTRYPAGDQPPDPAPRRPLRTLLAVVVVAAVLIGAVAVLNRTSGAPTPSAASNSNDGTGTDTGAGAGTSGTSATGTQPVTTTQNGIAVGFPHTSEGAQSAAVNYAVALGSADMYSPTSRKSIVTTVADPSAASRLLARFDPSYTTLGTKLGLQNGKAQNGLTFISRTVPVGTKADNFSPTRATIEVWTTGLIGIAGQSSTSPVTAYWQTSTMQLHWSNNDWKVVDVSTKDGPTPVNGSQVASSAQDIAGAVTQFGGFRYAR
jgi:hypothetical protein